MAIASPQAPSRPISTSPSSPFTVHRPSPLNPHHGALGARASSHAATNAATTTSTSKTRVHLSNLDRVLINSKPSRPAQPEHQDPSAGDRLAENEVDGDGDAKTLGLLSALNLPSFYPFMRRPTATEMSPRGLAHLRRLLSNSSRPSPKGPISSQWRELHGINQWAGLLDPLDESLRRELLRYGDFIQAAYQAFHSMASLDNSPAAPRPRARHRDLILPDRSYRTTKSLFATSCLSIPPWASRPGTPAWLTQRSSWIGFVAVCDNQQEIARMGRRDIVIVLRGTATCLEWAENLRTGLVSVEKESGDDVDDEEATGSDVPKVARGFLSLCRTPGDDVPSLAESVVNEVRRLLEVYGGEQLSITVVGHSLGAALALLVADEVRACAPYVPPVSVISFGGPKVGNCEFAEHIQKGPPVNVLRIVNAGDVITKVPGLLSRSKKQYVHVGAELLLDNRDSPCLRPDAGPACSHDLEAYLHLVDGFHGTGKPFRPDARRSVIRLLQFQKGSLRDSYVDAAKKLGKDVDAAAANYACPSPGPSRGYYV